jgi:hypothetical protein
MVMVAAAVPAVGAPPETEPGGGADVDAGIPPPPAHPPVPVKIRSNHSVDSFRRAFIAHHPE